MTDFLPSSVASPTPSPEDLYSGDLENITKAINILNECCSIGGFAFAEMAPALGTLAAVGGIVKEIIDIFKPDQHKEIMNKLAQLEGKLDQLSQKMSDKFNELRAFMLEYHFYTDFAEIAFALMQHVRDTLKHPNKDNKGILFAASQRTPPMESVYKLNYRLSNKSTSPLVWAMNADKLMSKSTYNKWRKIVEGVLCQFLFLETFINGLFWNKNMIGPNEMKEAIGRITKVMDLWKHQYLKNDYFWPDKIERLVHDTQDRHMNVGNEWKADHLRNALMEVMTDSIFYVFVYNDCAGYDHHAYYGRVDHMICSFRRGKCNVVVYRSRDARHTNKRDLEALKREVDSVTWGFIPKKDDYRKYVEDLYKGPKFHHIGMVGMIAARHDVYIRSTNDCDREPGYYVIAHIKNYVNYVFFAGFL